ncbi:MAG: DUF2442 domain-containing protein, partial [Acidithiobacillus sp.]
MPVVFRAQGTPSFSTPRRHGMGSLAKAVRFEGEMLWVDLLDGRTLGVPLAYFPRLLRA